METEESKGGGGVVEVTRIRTVDPAVAAVAASIAEAAAMDTGREGEDAKGNAVDGRATTTIQPSSLSSSVEEQEQEEERTPGHPAYGLFDVPAGRVEITLVSLPRGRRCSLIPTQTAVKNGFHELRDVKLVLEQSLIRTRSTLGAGDEVSAWHRGKRFDLRVGGVNPPVFGAVSCVDTDIEVDIVAATTRPPPPTPGVVPSPGSGGEDSKNPNNIPASDAAPTTATTTTKTTGFARGIGRRLGDTSDSATEGGRSGGGMDTADTAVPVRTALTTTNTNTTTAETTTSFDEYEDDLPPEPPAGDAAVRTITVQIRGPDGSIGGRRRFLPTDRMAHLFAYASRCFAFPVVRVAGGEEGEGEGEVAGGGLGLGREGGRAKFRLVARFPRRTFEMEDWTAIDGVGGKRSRRRD